MKKSPDRLKKAVIIVGHGSRQKGFGRAMEGIARGIRRDKRYSLVVCAYLEITSPGLEEAIDRCARQKFTEIRILPYFLLTGRHVRAHIPDLARRVRQKYGTKIKIVLCPYLGFDPALVSLAKKRILEGK